MDHRRRLIGGRALGPLVGALLMEAVLAVTAARPAAAHKNGIVAFSCDGCHTGGKPATVGLTANPMNPAVGQAVTLTLTVSQTNGSAAGFYISTMPQVGTFKTLQSGTMLTGSGTGVTHSMPIIGSGGVTSIQVGWSAAQPTGANFIVYALSANNDGTSKGDGGGMAMLSIASGCTGMPYYLDQDGDGYGTSDPGFQVLLDCSKPMGYSAVSGDCDDFENTVYPGAKEICDGRDNNCNGQIDEGLNSQTFCQDKDGDGHGVPGGMTIMGCTQTTGYGDCAGDCNDNDRTIDPGAPELCDGKDNNCNGQVDEGARMTCGVGWCRRDAIGCTSVCTPGAPTVETCNLFDDDCDGIVDNGTDLQLCGAAGLKCVQGICVSADSVDAGASTGGASGSGSGGVSGGASGGAPGHGTGGLTGHGTGGGSGGAPHAGTGGAVNPGGSGGSGGTPAIGAGGSAPTATSSQGGCDVAGSAAAVDVLGIALGLGGMLLARRRTAARRATSRPRG